MRSNARSSPCTIVKRLRTALLALLIAGLASAAPATPASEFQLTLRAPESPSDQRQLYLNAAMQLALDKTVASHGPYQLLNSPPMNKQRALISARQKTQPNLMILAGPAEARAVGSLAPVRFPLMLGVTGYRVCFVSPQAREAVANTRTLDELRQRFSLVQGTGWADVAVLRANGFHVTESPSYDSLFRMVAKGRADLFCRSVLEVQAEAQAQAALPDLVLDRTFALHYDLPHFLYTHRDNQAAIERLTEGLQRAYADGSLQALMRQHLQAPLQFVELHKRRLYLLRTEPPPDIAFDYRSYKLDLPGAPR